MDAEEGQVAKKVLVIMVNPSMGMPAFVARLLPVFSLKHEFLKDRIDIVMKVLFEVGGYVFLIMTDNLSVNRKTFKIYHKDNKNSPTFFVPHPNTNHVFPNIYTFYDVVHNLKCLRNNFISEKTQRLRFWDPDSNIEHIANFKDIIAIYKEESSSFIKETKLTYAALYPNNFEKQKVQLKKVLRLEGRAPNEFSSAYIYTLSNENG